VTQITLDTEEEKEQTEASTTNIPPMVLDSSGAGDEQPDPEREEQIEKMMNEILISADKDITENSNSNG
jgi:hypothetical protein